MDQLLSHWLRIRPDERRRTALLFLFLFAATSFVIIGRTARDALLLSRQSGVHQLPLIYVGIAIASSLMVAAYNRLLVYWKPYLVIRVTLAAAIVSLLGLRVLIERQWPAAYPALYIFHEVAGSLIVLQFWTFANESFTSREARRLFGIIGSGGVMAGTVCGFGGAWLAPRLGTANLLLVCVAALFGCALLAAAVRTLHEAAAEPLELRSGASRPQARAVVRGYAAALGAMAVALVVSVSIVDYEFKVIAQQHFSEDRLAFFFGSLYGACGLLSFLMHLLLTGRLLTRAGILPALLALPSALAFGGLALLFSPGLFAAIYAKAADATLRYSLNDTCMQLLYLPVDVPGRRRLKALIDGGLKPLAIGATGVLLAVTGPGSSAMRGLALLLLVGVGTWIGLALWLRRGYVAALLARLQQPGGIDEEMPVTLSDVASTQALIEALRSPDDPVVLGALELLPAHRGIDWSSQVQPLLLGRSLHVRLAAMDHCRREGLEIPGPILVVWLSDPDPEVRAAAVEVLQGTVAVRRFLGDPAPIVQAQAIVGLVRTASVSEAEAAFLVLERMRSNSDPLSRRWAAWVMGELQGPEDGLRRLINDSSPEVEREAIEAAGKAQLLGLVPLLINRLHTRRVGDEAAVALGQYGDVALGHLLALFPLPVETEIFRQNVYAALRNIGSRRVVEELLRRLPTDRALRHEALEVSFQLIRTRQEGALRMDQIRVPLMVEIQDCYQWYVIADTLTGGAPWEMLRTAVAEEGVMARERAFLLLAHVYPVRPMQTLQLALQSRRPSQVSMALEVVDEILEPELRLLLVPLLESIPLAERVARGLELFRLVQLGELEWCRYFLRSEDRWLVLCSLHTVRALRATSLQADVRAVISSPDGLLREAALVTLSSLLPRAERLELWRGRLEDETVPVRRLARQVQDDPEGIMISSVDKVLFLKRVELFSQLPGRELLNLAAIAEQVTYPERAVIFEEGDDGDSLYLILAGQVRVTRGGRPIATLGPRECFGEMAILDREPRSATVTAVDQVSALRIERDSFYDLMAQKREIALGIIRILVHRLREANERVSGHQEGGLEAQPRQAGQGGRR